VDEPQSTLPEGRAQNTTLHLALVLGGLFVSCCSGEARADNLDQALYEQGPLLIQDCQTKNHQNVGTLKFRVQIGNSAPSGPNPLGRGEPLASNLADRLENLLVIFNHGLKTPLQIIRSAGKVAGQKDLNANTRSPAALKKLFEGIYPLAWGGARVSAHAFFTGEVILSEDLQTARVAIVCLDKGSPSPRPVTAFTVKLDRSILADVGLPFHLDSKARQSRPPDLFDQAAIASALALRKKAGSVPATREPELVQVTVLANKVDSPPFLLRPRSESQPALLPLPKVGEKISLRLKNPGPGRVGVFLKVSGRSTRGEQIDEGTRCSRWILDPGKETTVSGYLGFNPPLPFMIRSAAPSNVMPAVEDLIEWCVYAAGPGEEETPRPTISLRGLDENERKRSSTWSLEVLQGRLQRRAGLPRGVKRSVEADVPQVIPGEEALQKAVFAEYRRLRFDKN
jgi:hypothetical protein